MSKMTPVEMHQKTATNLSQSAAKLHTRIGHWAPEIEVTLAEAQRATLAAAKVLAVLSPTWEPPHKKPVRRFTGIVAGDRVTVAERHRKRTPGPLRAAGLELEVVVTEADLVTVEHQGVRYALERRTLVPVAAGAKKPPAAAPVQPTVEA